MMLTIEHHKALLKVDQTALDADLSFTVQGMYQFIGELSVVAGELVLRARIARSIDGLDLALYDQALQLMRRHLRTADADLMADV